MESQISHSVASSTGKQRVIISISIPDLNESFSYCSTTNESTRLLLLYIKYKLKNHGMDGKPFSAVVVNGDVIDGKKRISEVGIVNGSTVIVDFGQDKLINSTENRSRSTLDVDEVVQVCRSSGIKNCISLIQNQYMDNALKIIRVLKDETADKDNESVLVSSLYSFLQSTQDPELTQAILEWLLNQLKHAWDISHFFILMPWVLKHLSTVIISLQRVLLEILSILCADESFLQQADIPSITTSMLPLLHSDLQNPDLVFNILQAIAAKKQCTREILTVAGHFAETTSTPSLLSQLLQLLNVLLQSEEGIDVCIHSSALKQVMSIGNCHEPSLLVEFFTFLQPLVRHCGDDCSESCIALLHHLILLQDLVNMMEAAVSLYPRHNELAYAVQSVLQPLCNEGFPRISHSFTETACIYMVRTEFLSLCVTHLIALDDDTQLISTTISSLTRMAQIAPFFIDAIVESEVVMNAIKTVPSNLLDSSLWDTLLDFLIALQAAPSGVALIQSAEIRKEIQSYEIFFRHLPGLAEKVKRLFAQEKPLPSPLTPRVEYQVPICWTDSPRLIVNKEAVCWQEQSSFLGFCLHCLISDSMSVYIPALVHAIMLMMSDEKSFDLLHNQADLASVIPCLSYACFSHKQSEAVMSDFGVIADVLIPLFESSFYSDETLAVLVDAVETYTSNLNLVDRFLSVLTILTRKQDLRGRLKSVGIVKMLEHLESRVALQEEPASLQELQHANSMGDTRSVQSVDQLIRKKLRSIAKNLGNLNMSESVFDDQNEIMLMKEILHRLIEKDRNEKLSVLDGLANLVESDYNRLLNAFLVLHGVRTIIQIASSASSDKEVVTRSMLVLMLLTKAPSVHRYVDLPITAEFCVQVLNNFVTTPTCVQLTLHVLQAMKSEAALHRLESECSTFHKVLLQNDRVAEICESVMFVMGSVAANSALFRQQCLKEDVLGDIFNVLNNYMNRSSILIAACGLFTAMASEVAFQQSFHRFTIIDALSRWTLATNAAEIAGSKNPMLEALQVLVGISASTADHFVKKQGLMGIVFFLDQNQDSVLKAVCCRIIVSLCKVTNASHAIIATGVISRIARIIKWSNEWLIDAYSALRYITMQSVDCLQEVVNSNVSQILVSQLGKCDNSECITEIVWILSLLSSNCCCIVRISCVDGGWQQLKKADVEDSIATIMNNPSSSHVVRKYCESIRKNMHENLNKGRHSSLNNEKNTLDLQIQGVSQLMNSSLMQVISLFLISQQQDEAKWIDAMKQLLEALDPSKAGDDVATNKEVVYQSGIDESLIAILMKYPHNEVLERLTLELLFQILKEKTSSFPFSENLKSAIEALLKQPWLLADLKTLTILVKLCTLIDMSENISICSIMLPIILAVHRPVQEDPDFSNFVAAVIDLLLRLAFYQLLSEHYSIHVFFLLNQDLIVSHATRLLKAEIVHQVVYRASLVAQHESVHCIQLSQPLGAYVYSILAKDKTHSISDILELISYVGQLEKVRKDFVQAGGLMLLLSFYWKHHDAINVEKFGVVLLGLLPYDEDREIPVSAIMDVCSDVIKWDYAQVEPIIAILPVMQRIVTITRDLSCFSPHKKELVSKMPLFPLNELLVKQLIDFLVNMLQYAPTEAKAKPIVELLMEEINRGACFPSIIHQSIQLLEEFATNEVVCPLLLSAAPSTYQTVFMAAISNDGDMKVSSEFYLVYLDSEENAKKLIDSGILDMLAVALRKPQNEENSLYLLRILYRLCQYKSSLQSFLNDVEFCDLVKNFVLRLRDTNKEMQHLSESLFDYLLNGPQVNAHLEVVNPADYDFGEPPSEIL